MFDWIMSNESNLKYDYSQTKRKSLLFIDADNYRISVF
jgi:hypothetical protein